MDLINFNQAGVSRPSPQPVGHQVLPTFLGDLSLTVCFVLTAPVKFVTSRVTPEQKAAHAHLQFTLPGSHRALSVTNDIISLPECPVANASSCFVGSTPASSQLHALWQTHPTLTFFFKPSKIQSPLSVFVLASSVSLPGLHFPQSLCGLVLTYQISVSLFLPWGDSPQTPQPQYLPTLASLCWPPLIYLNPILMYVTVHYLFLTNKICSMCDWIYIVPCCVSGTRSGPTHSTHIHFMNEWALSKGRDHWEEKVIWFMLAF